MARKLVEDCTIKVWVDGLTVHSPKHNEVMDKKLSVVEMLKAIGLNPKSGDTYLFTIERTRERK